MVSDENELLGNKFLQIDGLILVPILVFDIPLMSKSSEFLLFNSGDSSNGLNDGVFVCFPALLVLPNLSTVNFELNGDSSVLLNPLLSSLLPLPATLELTRYCKGLPELLLLFPGEPPRSPSPTMSIFSAFCCI